MAVFRREQVATLIRRLAEPPRFIIALFGPRQTGKTTIVRQALQRIERPWRYLAVDEPDSEAFEIPPTPAGTSLRHPHIHDAEWLVLNWERARRKADRSPNGSVLVLDEIQKIPQWLETVKGLWDADRAVDRPLHVVILGSAPLLMQSGLTESLAGRFEPIRVTHWSFPEMAAAFDFDLRTYLFFGGYPGAASRVQDPMRWREYVLRSVIDPNIKRDVLSMTRVDKPGLLKKVFDLGAAWSGQILSYNRMLGPLQDAGNTTTLARYLDLLADAGLLAGLSKYVRSLPHRGSSPKLNVFNTALMTAGSGYAFEQAVADRTFWGRTVESAVGAHLLNTATSDIGVYHWRDGRHEVDFVLERGPHLVGVEVKSGPIRRSPHGLEAFGERFGPQRTLVVGEGGVPLNEFLAAPAGQWCEDG